MTASARELLLIKHGNLLLIAGADGLSAPPDEVFSSLHGLLTYDHKELLYGAAARDPNTGKRRRVEVTERRMYGSDSRGRLYTNFGLLRRCHRQLTETGFQLRYVDASAAAEAAHPRPQRYETNFANVERCFSYRPRQEECLKAIAASHHGLIHAVTAFGKRIMIVMTCLLYNKAKIHICIRSVPLVNQMVNELTRHIPNIGQWGGGRKGFGDRITVFTRDSLGHSDFDADILLGDEIQELVTDGGAELIAKYHGSRNFAFTATPTGRTDGSDLRIEALFGPTIFHIPYWEGVELGLVAPIRVIWHDVILASNPAADLQDVARQRYGIWFNDERNDIIASHILAVPADEQFLVLTDTVYHAVELYRRVRASGREVALIYDKIDIDRFRRYVDAGAIPSDLPRMTPELKEAYRRRFEAGEIDAIATKTWEVGIDATNLQHLFVAASFRSEIKAQQAPGRVSRVNADGKLMGIVHDYRDQFDEGFHSAATARRRVYESLRWSQVLDSDGGLISL